MNILLFGGTGMVGSRIAAEAAARGHEVTSVTRSGRDGTVRADARHPEQLGELVAASDAVVMATSGPRDGTDPRPELLASAQGILSAMRSAGRERLVIVGGAGSLRLPSGERVVDQPDFPALYKQEALAHAALLDYLRAEAEGVAWTYFSPAAEISPGEKRGGVKLGGDDLVTDADGRSHISAEDYAVVLVDELEQSKHVGQRMTAAYA